MLPDKTQKNIFKLIILSGVISLFLSFLVYINIFGYSRDQFNYVSMIETLVTKGCRDSRGNYNIPNVEFGFQEELCALSYVFKDVNTIYASQVFISIFLKLIFFSIIFTTIPTASQQSRISRIAFLMGVIVYFLRYFPLHDFTQIRISISIGFTLISLPFLMPTLISPYEVTLNFKKNDSANNTHNDKAKAHRFSQPRFRAFAFSSIVCIAFSFHHSIALAIPFIIIATRVNSKQQFSSIILLTGIVSAILTGFLYLLILSNVTFLYSDDKLYTNYDDINPFSILKILDILSVIVASQVINFRVPMQAFCLTAYTCALIQFYCIIFSGLPTTYAFRLSEILIVFSAFLVVSLNTKKQLVLLAPIVLMASLRAFFNYIDESFFIFF